MPDGRDQNDIIKRWEEEGMEKWKEELGVIVTIKELEEYCDDRELLAEL